MLLINSRTSSATGMEAAAPGRLTAIADVALAYSTASSMLRPSHTFFEIPHAGKPAQEKPEQDLPAEDLPAEDLPAEDLPAEDLPA